MRDVVVLELKECRPAANVVTPEAGTAEGCETTKEKIDQGGKIVVGVAKREDDVPDAFAGETGDEVVADEGSFRSLTGDAESVVTVTADQAEAIGVGLVTVDPGGETALVEPFYAGFGLSGVLQSGENSFAVRCPAGMTEGRGSRAVTLGRPTRRRRAGTPVCFLSAD